MQLLCNHKITGFNVLFARNFFERAGGLIVHKKINATDAFLIKPCNSVHTLMMRYAIDVVYLDINNRILKICSNMLPNRLSLCLRAKSVFELNAGASTVLGLSVGDLLTLKKN